MSENIFLIASPHILVVHRLAGLAVDLPYIQRTIFEATIEVFDVTHHPRHFNTSFYGELASCLHLPSRPRASPWPDFGESSDDNDFVKVHHTLEFGHVSKRSGRFKSWEIEAEISARCNIDGLENMLCLQAVDDLEVCGIVSGNCAAKLALFVEAETVAYPMTPPARHRYSPQLSELQRLNKVSSDIFDSE
jgi:hypothetical protein